MWTSLRKDVSLVLPYGDIQSVELADDLLNTVIIIRTGADAIYVRLSLENGTDQESASIVNQRRLLLDFIRNKLST